MMTINAIAKELNLSNTYVRQLFEKHKIKEDLIVQTKNTEYKVYNLERVKKILERK